MSLTLRKVPQELVPVYNQVIIVATSTQQTQLNYQLVSNINCNGELVGRIKTPVNPEGYIVVDLHKHLENKISFDFQPEVTGWSIATGSFASYSVTFQDEFRAEWDFIDNFFSPIGATSYVGFVSQETPYFSVGDIIFVNQDEGYSNASYNGQHEILSITQSGLTWSITTDALWVTASPTEGGVINYANYQLTTLPINDLIIYSSATISSTASSFPTKFAFNGVLSFLDYNNWNYDDWDANTSTLGKFFTNAPKNYEIDIDSYMFLNLYQNAASELRTLRVRTNLGTFSITNGFTTISPNTAQRFLQVNVSPRVFVDNGWIDDTTTQMELFVNNQSVSQTIDTKTFKISNKCGIYDKMSILFMDKMGSFVPYTFNKVSRETRNISRSNYQENYGRYAPATQNWGYNSWDRGKKSLDTVVTEQYTLNSDWIDQKTSDYLMELFESPEAYWVDTNDNIVAINITVQSVERKKVINEQLINYVLTFELSNKNMSQR